MASDEDKFISTQDYRGKDRRKEVEVVVKKCFCHTAHESKLQNHANGLHDNKEEHETMWEDIKQRTPMKLFYVFVAIVVGGLAFVYNGIHTVSVGVAVINTKIEDQARDIEKISDDLKDAERERHDILREHETIKERRFK